MFHLLLYSSNGYNGHSGARLKPGAQSSFQVSHTNAGPLGLSYVAFLGALAGNGIGRRAARTQTDSHMECR